MSAFLQKNQKMFLFSHFIEQMIDTGDKYLNKLIYCFPFVKEINGSLDTKMTVIPLLSDF